MPTTVVDQFLKSAEDDLKEYQKRQAQPEPELTLDPRSISQFSDSAQTELDASRTPQQITLDPRAIAEFTASAERDKEFAEADAQGLQAPGLERQPVDLVTFVGDEDAQFDERNRFEQQEYEQKHPLRKPALDPQFLRQMTGPSRLTPQQMTQESFAQAPLPKPPPERGFFENVSEAYDRGKEQIDTDLGMYEAGLSRDRDQVAKVLALQDKQQKQEQFDPIEGNFLSNLVYKSAQILPGMISGAKAGVPTAIAGAGMGAGLTLAAGQAGPQIALPEEIVTVPAGAAIGAYAGWLTGSTQFWYKQGVGNMYGEMIRDGIDPELAWRAAQVGGIPYAMIEAAQVTQLAPVAKKTVSKAAQRGTLAAVKKLATTWAKIWPLEVAEEVAQKAVEIVTKDVATHLNKTTDLKIDVDYFVDRAVELHTEARAAGQAMALLPLPGAAVQAAGVARRGAPPTPTQAAKVAPEAPLSSAERAAKVAPRPTVIKPLVSAGKQAHSRKQAESLVGQPVSIRAETPVTGTLISIKGDKPGSRSYKAVVRTADGEQTVDVKPKASPLFHVEQPKLAVKPPEAAKVPAKAVPAAPGEPGEQIGPTAPKEALTVVAQPPKGDATQPVKPAVPTEAKIAWEITRKEIEVPGALESIPRPGIEPGGALYIAHASTRTPGGFEVSKILHDSVLKKDIPFSHVEFETAEGALAYLGNVHKINVQSAIEQGKPVPAAVLAEYPDLAAKGAVPTQAAPTEKPAEVTTEMPDVHLKAPLSIDVSGQKTIKAKTSEAKKQFQEIVKSMPKTSPNEKRLEAIASQVRGHIAPMSKALEKLNLTINKPGERDVAQEEVEAARLTRRAQAWNDALRKKARALLTKITFDSGATLWVPTSQEALQGHINPGAWGRAQGPLWSDVVAQMASIPERGAAKKPTIPKKKAAPKGPAKLRAIKQPAPKDIVAAVYDAAAGHEATRYALNGVFVDKDNIVATDGRILFTVKQSGKFVSVAPKQTKDKGVLVLDKDAKPFKATRTTKDGETVDILRFPNHKDIIPADNRITTVNVQQAYNNTAKAALFADPSIGVTGMNVYLNPDGDIGFTVVNPDAGTSNVNVQKNATYITTLDPTLFRSLLRAHAQLGNETVELHSKKEFGRPIKMTGSGGTTSVIMPINPSVPHEFGDKYDRSEAGFILVPGAAEIRHLVSLPSKIAKALTRVGGRHTMQSIDYIATFAPKAGEQIGLSLMNITDREKELVGKWVSEMEEAIGPLNKKERANYREAARDNAEPMNKKVAAAVEQMRELADRMGELMEEIGLPVAGEYEGGLFQRKQDYYPIQFSEEINKQIQHEKGELYNKLVDWVAQDMQAREMEYVSKDLRPQTKNWSLATSRKQAAKFLKDRRKHTQAGAELSALWKMLSQGEKPTTKLASQEKPWQYHRAFEYPDEFLDKNPERVWERHIRSAARRIAEAENWGVDSKRLKVWAAAGATEAAKVAKSKGKVPDDAQVTFLQAVGQLVGYESDIQGLKSAPSKPSAKAMRVARATTGSIHLANVSAPVRNIIWGQMLNMTHFGVLRPHAQFLGILFHPSQIKAARKAGALEHSGISHLFAEGVMPEIVKIARAPMGAAEVMLRTTAAHTGLGVWQGAIKRAHKTGKAPGWLMRELTRRDVGFTEQQVNAMVKHGVLTDAEKAKMMRGAVNITQFSADPKDIPLSWTSEGGRFITQFYAMAYKHTQNTVGYTLNELGYGNLRPVLRFAVAAIFAGLAIDVVYDAMSGRMPSKKDLDKLEKWLRRIGNALGIIEIPLEFATETRASKLARRVTPASVGTAISMVTAANKAVQHFLKEPAATKPEQQKRREGVVKALAKLTGAGRNIYGQAERAKQGRISLLAPVVEKQPEKAEEFYRRSLVNLYRRDASKTDIIKLEAKAREAGVNIAQIRKDARSGAIRKELYDNLYRATRKGDTEAAAKARRQLSLVGATLQQRAQAMENRKAKDVGREPRRIRGTTSSRPGREGREGRPR